MLHIGRVPIPFGTARSSILTGIAEHSRIHARRGGVTTVVVSHARDARVADATNLLVDYTERCPREYFTRWDVLLDTAAARWGRRRRRHGSLFIPAIRALKAAAVDVVLLHEGHFAFPSVNYWREMWSEVRLFLYVNTPLSRVYGSAELRAGLAVLDGCIFVSDYTRDQVRARIGSIPCPSFVVHNGVDGTVFHTRGRDGQASVEGPVRITFAGELSSHKGPDLLIRAAAALPDHYRLRLIGDAPDGGSKSFRTDLGTLARRLSVSMTIESRMAPDALAQAFRESDIVVVPSVWPEPFGRVSIEAMACGAAVLSSNRGGLPEACGDAALFVDPEDIPSMTDALAMLMEPSQRGEYVSRGLRRAEQMSWQRSYETLLSVLDA